MKAGRDRKPKKSLGTLYKSNQTNERSPELTGLLKIQRHTFEAIAEGFERHGRDELSCNIAAWYNEDRNGEPHCNVELSSPFAQKRRPKRDIFGWLQDK